MVFRILRLKAIESSVRAWLRFFSEAADVVTRVFYLFRLQAFSVGWHLVLALGNYLLQFRRSASGYPPSQDRGSCSPCL